MLVAFDDVLPNEELTVAALGPILSSENSGNQWLVTFDGGARFRETGEGRCAGAGAIIRAPNEEGQLVVRGEAIAALPGERWSPIAEAWGMRLALQLADRAIGCRSLHIAGDNLAVVRFAAAQRKLHDPSHEGLIAQPLATLLVRGTIPSWSAIRRKI